MRKVTAFCPTSLSFIFRSLFGSSIRQTGSIGIGCTLDKEVTVTVKSANKTNILFNGKPIHFPTVEYALSSIIDKSVAVNIKSPLPLGFGFGVSSASTLAALFAVNKIFPLNMNKMQLAQIAHEAEIINHTGLGSVATQITGGFLLKNKPGLPPSDFIKLPFAGKKLYAIIIDKLETPSILENRNKLSLINQTADKVLAAIQPKQITSLEKALDIAYDFAVKSQLLTNQAVADFIGKIRHEGGHATMAMLGQVVISNKKPNFNTHYRVEELTITDKSVYIITHSY